MNLLSSITRGTGEGIAPAAEAAPFESLARRNKQTQRQEVGHASRREAFVTSQRANPSYGAVGVKRKTSSRVNTPIRWPSQSEAARSSSDDKFTSKYVRWIRESPKGVRSNSNPNSGRM